MRHSLRWVFVATAASSAAVVIYLSLTLPPASVTLGPGAPATAVLGAYHVHSVRSDGSGTIDEIAAAAARAGLKFVILTDHGDGTRTPDPPQYRSGVLCIDAAEITTTGGHVVALGLSSPAPYPLAGEPADVIDDIHRLGGRAVIAHPDSPKFDLSWRGPTTANDGIEWLNADSEWRDKSPARLLSTSVRYLFRGPESIASLFERPVPSLQRWDMEARTRPVFGLAALDAHARIGWQDTSEPRGRAAIDRPSYDAMFRTLGDVAVLGQPLSGNAVDDADRVLAAIESGRVFSIIRAFAEPASLEFSADRGGLTSPMGAHLPAGEPVTLRARVPEAPGARMTMVRDGRPVATGQGRITYAANTPGVYRVEVAWPGQVVPWILSNPIAIEPLGIGPPDSRTSALGSEVVALPARPEAWHSEHDATSTGVVRGDDDGLSLTFALGGGQPQGQFSALVSSVDAKVGADRIVFNARSSRPMRISVQIKLPNARPGQERWRRSIYVDPAMQSYVLPLRDFQEADGPRGTWSPNVTHVSTLLFVIDTLNARPGDTGTLWVVDPGVGVGVIDPGQ